MALSLACAPHLYLPLDLLPLILAAVPPRPRLVVVSLVCKAWRRAVLSTMTVLPSGDYKPTEAANVGAFARLAVLCPLEQLPPSIVKLNSLPPLPSLRRLTIWGQEESNARSVSFLHGCSALTSLAIVSEELDAFLQAGLQLDRFPHLREISLVGSACRLPATHLSLLRALDLPMDACLTEPLAPIQGYLRSLSITAASPVYVLNVLKTNTFPYLRSLSINIDRELQEPSFPSLLSRSCPSLTSLRFTNWRPSAAIAYACARLSPVLTDLEPTETLLRATRLRSLILRNTLEAQRCRAALSRLTSLDISRLTPDFVLKAPALARLWLSLQDMGPWTGIARTVARWELPSLRVVHIRSIGSEVAGTTCSPHHRGSCDVLDMSALFAMFLGLILPAEAKAAVYGLASALITHAASRFPLLKEIALDLMDHGRSPYDWRAIARVIAQAEQAGIDRVRLALSSAAVPPEYLPHPKWLEIIVQHTNVHVLEDE